MERLAWFSESIHNRSKLIKAWGRYGKVTEDPMKAIFWFSAIADHEDTAPLYSTQPYQNEQKFVISPLWIEKYLVKENEEHSVQPDFHRALKFAGEHTVAPSTRIDPGDTPMGTKIENHEDSDDEDENIAPVSFGIPHLLDVKQHLGKLPKVIRIDLQNGPYTVQSNEAS